MTVTSLSLYCLFKIIQLNFVLFILNNEAICIDQCFYYFLKLSLSKLVICLWFFFNLFFYSKAEDSNPINFVFLFILFSLLCSFSCIFFTKWFTWWNFVWWKQKWEFYRNSIEARNNSTVSRANLEVEYSWNANRLYGNKSKSKMLFE